LRDDGAPFGSPRKRLGLFQNLQKSLKTVPFLQKTNRFFQKMAQNIQKALQKGSILAHLHYCAVVFSLKTQVADFRLPPNRS